MSLILKAKKKGLIFSPAVFYKASVAGASYTYAGSADNDGSVGNVWTVSTINIGSAAPSRLVILCLSITNNPTLAITVNTVPMTQAVINTTGNQSSVWYGSVPSGAGPATIVVTGGNFLAETMLCYYATGLSSNTPVGTVQSASTGTIAVNGGDFLFAAGQVNAGVTSISWTGSTQTPTGTHSDLTQSLAGFSADWIVSSSGTFNLTVVAAGGQYAAANWR